MSQGVVLLSGCSSGFGLHAAVYLKKCGLSAVATMRDLGKRARLDEAAAAAGVTIPVESLDVTDQASVEDCLSRVLDRHGPIDGLVNNAGYGIGGFAYDLSMDEIRAQLETNFFGLVRLTKGVLPHMVSLRRGRIVNVSSIAGRVALPILSAYSASKFAVEGFSEALRYELIPFGVSVCLVEPGSFRTDIFERNRRMGQAIANPQSPYCEINKSLEPQLQRLLRHFPTDLTPVSKAIHRALTVAHPPFRQVVGKDARLQRLAAAIVPQRLFDAFVVKQIRSRSRAE